MRPCLLTLVWTLVFAWCVAPASAQAPIEAFEAASPADAGITILPPGTPGAAAALEHASRCHPALRRAALVDLGWKAPAADGAQGQRIDLSMFRDGFETGRFEVSRLLPASADAAGVEAPQPGIHYYWRVLTRTPAGWVSSRVERFEVPICPWDEPRFPGRPAPGSENSSPGSR